jgi:DNA-binding response OmpR family regulator
MYVKKLINEGFAVESAVDGEEGLKKALNSMPDLILLDVKMPKMDGITMLKKLRGEEKGKQVPVILLTNVESNDRIVWDVVDTKPSYYLLKTDNRPETVVEKIKEVLNLNN